MPTEATSDISTTLLPSAAARVWANPELRGLIIDQMSLGEVRKALSLSKDCFHDMAKMLYKRFDYYWYQPLLTRTVSVRCD
jgi:hypothetical protein